MSRRTPVIVSAICATWLLASAPAAAAHAALRSSDPADGALLQVAPSAVTLAFTEPPDPKLTVIHVLDASRKQMETGRPEPVSGRRSEIQQDLGALTDGVYTVTWRTVSETDGHVTAGGFSFGVGVSPAGAPPPPGERAGETPSPSPLSVVAKWSLYVGLSLVLAAGTAGIAAFGGVLPRRRPLLLAASALAAGGVVGMIVAERSAVGVPLGDLLSSTAGHRFLWLAAAVAAASTAAIVAAVRRNRLSIVVAGCLAAVAMLVRAIGGHASGDDLAWVNVGLQWVHLVGVGVWIGGLPWLFLILRAGDAPQRDAQVPRFSRIAGFGLGTVAVTGVLRAVDELGGWGRLLDIFRSSYGTDLAIKVGVALMLVALGTLNHFVNVPRSSTASRQAALRRTVGGELVIAAGVFALTGVLTGLPPDAGMGPATPAPVERVVATGHDFATTTRVRLEVTPGTVGPNRFVARVTDYDTGEPVPADRVTLEFSLADGHHDVGSSLGLRRQPDGTWAEEGTAIAIDGAWDVMVLVQDAAGSTQIALRIRPRVPPPTIDVSRQEGQPDLYTIAFSSGVQIQSYVDPGSPGINQFHVTAFDPSGNELPLRSAHVEADGPDGTAPLEMRRFEPGHFVADMEIVPGTWHFLIDVTPKDGSELSARFQQTFEG